MHLLAATPGGIDDGSEAVDLNQDPADIVILSAADTEIACFAAAQARRQEKDPSAPSLRCANLLHLGHNYSVDLYLEQVIGSAKLVIGRLLGGRGYWSYGVDEVTALCRDKGIALAWLPGDDQPDTELHGLSTLPAETLHRLWQYCVHGGIDNAEHALAYAATLMDHAAEWQEPAPLLRAGLYWPGKTLPDITDLPHDAAQPTAAIVFYRALYQAANLRVIDALITALQDAGINPLPIYAASLKDPVSADTVSNLMARGNVEIVLNGTGFALSVPGAVRSETPFDGQDCPVLQVVFSGGNEAAWRDGTRGLAARDIAMNVALPEVDGRLLSRAVSFKGSAKRDPLTQADIVTYDPVPDRCQFVADLAGQWLRLRRTPASDRRVAIIFANYPNKDARLGNGVGLDTPAGTMALLDGLRQAGYHVEGGFKTSDALINHLKAGPTNAAIKGREIRERLALPDYHYFFSSLPDAVQQAVTDRWGAPEADPFFHAGETDCGFFALPVFRLGHIAIGLQPARGYNIDPKSSYHSPDLVPPHGYLAFYAWIREAFGAHAALHMGKHGNLEWLPGKAVALSENCFPEAILGPMPHLYPFIVNDPGEGTQAKRRAQAVIIDHLTPPLTRAESYGPLKDLELLVDEYFEAAGVDPRRIKVLKRDILDLTHRIGLSQDCGIQPDEDEEQALAKLDNYLCELKEMQIRDGLHIFGRAPQGDQMTDLLVALARVPRGTAKGGDASLIRALAKDFGFDGNFDPLDCPMGDAWTDSKPNALQDLDIAPWRSNGDTVERLEALGRQMVLGQAAAPGRNSAAVLDWITGSLKGMVENCGPAEINGVLTALDGRFLDPGPSGAPTRGRPDVLPTGRNFYSVDTRTVPTPAAWTLGWKSAQLLVETYAQEHGDYPTRLALSCWGTANMRTGGDDIAQALALMGVRPQWDSASRRVTGFEILPADMLDRPRVDVTLRISGFFRDAFPNLIDLVDSAARAVAALDEPAEINPLAANVQAEAEALSADGMDSQTAQNRAGARIFGSKPGAYGAGLQALIDEKGWTTDADLAEAYLAWGGYAYGAGQEGTADRAGLERRLSKVQAILHNQDNREHDLLDSDDYYQFEGGMAVTTRALTGQTVPVYHNDHSRPESPKVRKLEDEIGRVVRARVVNPKWIAGVMRHGYKGAFEMSATVDYLFAFAATARAVSDHHFDAVFEAYLMDPAVREFLQDSNPDALHDIAARLTEAQERGLWSSRRNDTRPVLAEIVRGIS
ncbi:MAG: cobaltochelatase subunit CobN [Rhodospirillaceae bacterium]|jgi:cobaltochelatase CobN|uniref:cobaltochelatase subunit CobN n=1 Tax=Hwanghaeella sp. 1Z406 TaxID=3402811 RepID=UPI000C457877|nr:cobaltochelatase subunit CobN [Rhodospirillaceae bacterium]|tara:strand:+ start:14842 stop:18594 length:3753 start_codon:yes stop_codon:yes gene_type:complete